MSTSRQVKCINKTDRTSRYERISHIGADWGKVAENAAITQIENGIFDYYVQVGLSKAKVIIGTHLGRKYLKTESDTTLIDNLLSLKECA